MSAIVRTQLIAVAIMLLVLIGYYWLSVSLRIPGAEHLGWAMPFGGGLAASFFAAQRHFESGMLAIVPALLITVAAGYLFGRLGVGDSLDFEGLVFLTGIGAVAQLALVSLGALLGTQLARRKQTPKTRAQ